MMELFYPWSGFPKSHNLNSHLCKVGPIMILDHVCPQIAKPCVRNVIILAPEVLFVIRLEATQVVICELEQIDVILAIIPEASPFHIQGELQW